MARFIDESFEGTGYEETWTETVGSGCTCDEDSSGPGTLPAGGGSQCLKLVNVSTADVYTLINSGASRATSYTRCYIYFDAVSMASSAELILIQLQSNSSTNTAVIALYNDAGTIKWRAGYHISAGWRYLLASSGPSTGTWYRVELQCDSGTLDLRIDSVSVGSTTGITLDRGNPQYWATVCRRGSGSPYATAYFDLFAVDDAGWIGAEASASIYPIYYYSQLM